MELDEKHTELFKEVGKCYDLMVAANDRLRKIQAKECEHPETKTCTHSPRPGQYFENTEVCAVCGKVINIPGMSVMGKVTTSTFPGLDSDK